MYGAIVILCTCIQHAWLFDYTVYVACRCIIHFVRIQACMYVCMYVGYVGLYYTCIHAYTHCMILERTLKYMPAFSTKNAFYGACVCPCHPGPITLSIEATMKRMVRPRSPTLMRSRTQQWRLHGPECGGFCWKAVPHTDAVYVVGHPGRVEVLSSDEEAKVSSTDDLQAELSQLMASLSSFFDCSCSSSDVRICIRVCVRSWLI